VRLRNAVNYVELDGHVVIVDEPGGVSGERAQACSELGEYKATCYAAYNRTAVEDIWPELVLGGAAGISRAVAKRAMREVFSWFGREAADDYIDIVLMNGRKPINWRFAGKTYRLDGELAKKYPGGVTFKRSGYPDFSPYSRLRVTDTRGALTGIIGRDSAFANAASGLKKTPAGFTWHHVEDGRTLLLVPSDLHKAVRHTGGAALIRALVRERRAAEAIRTRR